MSLSKFLESLLFYAPQSLQTLWVALVSSILSNAHARSSLLVHRVQPLLVLRQDVSSKPVELLHLAWFVSRPKHARALHDPSDWEPKEESATDPVMRPP
jgi:hypothetical protein